MAEAQQINGKCLCGAVTVTATITDPILRACHCDMCRQHSSSMYMSLATDPGSLKVEGPAKSYRSSEWAERGFCETCGSTLWYGTVADGQRHISAGLFENAGGAPLKLEFFIDEKPASYALEGDHRKMTAQECIEHFSPDEASNRDLS